MQWTQRIGMFLLVLMLTACSGAQPYKYHANNEAPSGPGLFTGADEEEENSSQAKD